MPLQVRSLPCQPCCPPWLPLHLPLQSRPPLLLPGTLPFSKVTFLLQIHGCQAGELETYSTYRKDKWYSGLRNIPMPYLVLWSQCRRQLSWSPACNTSAKPCLHWGEAVALMHLCCFPTPHILSLAMGQLWPCSGSMSPGKGALISLHPGRLRCRLPTAPRDNVWQPLSSTQGPATLFLTVVFFCADFQGSVSGPCWLVCPLTVSGWWSLPSSGVLPANGGRLCLGH